MNAKEVLHETGRMASADSANVLRRSICSMSLSAFDVLSSWAVCERHFADTSVAMRGGC